MNRKIVDYKVANNSIYVRELIREGFHPWGGLSAFLDECGLPHFFQAMVKYEEYVVAEDAPTKGLNCYRIVFHNKLMGVDSTNHTMAESIVDAANMAELSIKKAGRTNKYYIKSIEKIDILC